MATTEPNHKPDKDEGHSSASDEDRNSVVQVSFDPTNPYRRKSSLVNDPVPAYLRRAGGTGSGGGGGGGGAKTECLVHQFLEGQKDSRQRSSHAGSRSWHTHAHRAREAGGGVKVQQRDVSREEALDRALDPKGTSGEVVEDGKGEGKDGKEEDPRCKLLREESNMSDTSTAGQLDQQSWQDEMTATKRAETEGLHSRLLTKKQLSEMAWGVRELSRRLGSIRLKFRVKHIFLLTKMSDKELVAKARELTEWLLDEKGRGTRYTVYVQDELKKDGGFDVKGLVDGVWEKVGGERGDVERRVRSWDAETCRVRPHTFDFVITLGGDGTVLYASWLFQRIVPPVLSFALGSLGFMTKFDFGGFRETLTGAFEEGVSVSLRLRFEGTVMRSQRKIAVGGEGVKAEHLQSSRDLVDELIGEEKDDERTHRPDGTFEVLNEVVVERGPNPTMSEIEIFGDDEHFTTVMADGICVSTPTGSTAYNLAAGGSLCHPENPVMLLTAISPHTLSFRPIILPDTIVLRIGVPYDARTSSWASFDGRERVELRAGDYVTVSASRYPFASVQLHGRRSEDWINSISAKLAWNSRSRQKAFTS
ncbi:hypothetical protein OQA88_1909 [Cercophora sp. LCS_1]